jgi:hypothetical protein
MGLLVGIQELDDKGLRCGERLFPARFDVRGIAPKVLEFIEFANVFAHDMNDHVEVIEDNPIGIDAAVGAARADVLVFFEMFLDFVNDGAQVGFAGAGANHEIIGDAGDFSQVEDNDVFCLSVICQIPAEQRQFP